MFKKFFLLAAFLGISASADGGGNFLIDDFESGLRPGWERKDFKGTTRYTVVDDETGRVLKAESRGGATGLIYRHEYDPAEYPFLAWRWKIDRVLEKGDATRKSGDDYAARVYVIFPHWIPFRTKSINYIWANRLPAGSRIPNAYYGKAVMVAVESGPEKAGAWVEERRNVYGDYMAIFGEKPPMAGGIAIMTDTDQTGESATAWYDDIRLERGSAD